MFKKVASNEVRQVSYGVLNLKLEQAKIAAVNQQQIQFNRTLLETQTFVKDIFDTKKIVVQKFIQVLKVLSEKRVSFGVLPESLQAIRQLVK